MAKAKGGSSAAAAATTMVVTPQTDESAGKALARDLLRPHFRHGHTASVFVAPLLSGSSEKPALIDYAECLAEEGKKAEEGNMALASRLLSAQAITLDNMFTELARRAAANMGEYINAAERYGRLAFKAQSNCRATIEALAKLHQPREQIVKHVHVNEGGQAVVADEFHQHQGGRENGKSNKQSHATGSAGGGRALPSPDPLGNGVPIAGGQWEATLSDARRG